MLVSPTLVRTIGFLLALAALTPMSACYLSHEIEEGVEVAEPAWFVYRRRAVDGDGVYGFYAVRIGDFRTILVARSFAGEPFRWSPAEETVYAVVEQPEILGEQSVLVGALSLDGVERRLVVPITGRVSELSWSPDGRYLLVRSQEGRGGASHALVLDTVSPASPVVAEWTSEPPRGASDESFLGVVGWLPGRPWLNITTGSRGIRRCAIARAESGFELETLAIPEGTDGCARGWAPASGWWAADAWRRESPVLLLGNGPDSEGVEVATGDPRAAGALVEWSPTGDHLLWGTRVFRREGDELREVAAVADAAAVAPLGHYWLSGGRLLVAEGRGSRILFVMHSPEGDGFRADDIHASADSCTERVFDDEVPRVVFRCGPETFWWSEATGTRLLEQLRVRSPMAVDWSPRGGEAVVRREDALFELVSPDAELRRVTEPGGAVRWSPRSDAYAYVVPHGGLAVRDFAAGRIHPILEPDDEYLVQIVGFRGGPETE